MINKNKQPAWLIPKKKPNTSSMSTRNVVKKHLKEWNKDDDNSDKEELLKEISLKISDPDEYVEVAKILRRSK